MNTTQDTITAADLDTKTNTGRIYHLHRATLPQYDAQADLEAMRRAGPRIVPCSTIARLYLALRLWWRG